MFLDAQEYLPPDEWVEQRRSPSWRRFQWLLVAAVVFVVLTFVLRIIDHETRIEATRAPSIMADAVPKELLHPRPPLDVFENEDELWITARVPREPAPRSPLQSGNVSSSDIAEHFLIHLDDRGVATSFHTSTWGKKESAAFFRVSDNETYFVVRDFGVAFVEIKELFRGTLVDPMPAEFQRARDTIEAYGIQLDVADLRAAAASMWEQHGFTSLNCEEQDEHTYSAVSARHALTIHLDLRTPQLKVVFVDGREQTFIDAAEQQ